MEVRLLKNHYRAGIFIPAGSVIEVPMQKLEWFVKTGTAEEIVILTQSSDLVVDGEVSKPEESSHRKGKGKRKT